MSSNPIRTRLLGAALFAVVAAVYLHAQSTNVNVPVLHQNVSQWGGAALPAATTLNDAVSNPVAPLVASPGLLWDGAVWARHKASALATFPLTTTLTTRNQVGVALVDKPSRWAVLSNPAAGVQASATIAAEASVRHAVDCVAFSGASVVAPVLTAMTIDVRDGASGAGTIIWTYQLAVSNATGQNILPFTACGLNLVGTTNTAMTLEFSIGLANLVEAVSISGFNVS